MQNPPPGPMKLTSAGTSRMVILGVIVVVIVVACSGALNNAPTYTDAQIQIDADKRTQGAQQWDREEAARKDLLGKGYSPEDTEAAINTARAAQQTPKP